MNPARVHYWDASALVRIVAEDPAEQVGRAELRALFFGQGSHYATQACLAEAIGVFKRKWLVEKVYTLPEYVRTVREFYRLVVSHVAVDEIPVSVQLLDQAEQLMREHQLDFIDSIQMTTVLHGKFSVLIGDSASLFITADRRLARAAKRNGVSVWLVGSAAGPGRGVRPNNGLKLTKPARR
jgi:predicted nucleic acid-binding protein